MRIRQLLCDTKSIIFEIIMMRHEVSNSRSDSKFGTKATTIPPINVYGKQDAYQDLLPNQEDYYEVKHLQLYQHSHQVHN